MSCVFLDGPAAGKELDLHTAPHFLRVVIDDKGNVDALDQPEDTPTPWERIHVYVAERGSFVQVFVRPGGRYESARYCYLPTVADAMFLRERDNWIKWVTTYGDVAARAAGLDPYIQIPDEET